MDKKRVLIFYHKEDNDGLFSAAMIYNYLINELGYSSDNIDHIGLDYNAVGKYTKKSIKSLSYDYSKIFLTDISFPVPIMEYMYDLFGDDMIWIDHHAPIIDAVNHSKKLVRLNGVREINRSAILCAYKYCYDPFDIQFIDEHDKIPEMLRILSAWDSFTFENEGYELDYVKIVNEGINTIFDLDFYRIAEEIQDLESFSKEYIPKAYAYGKTIIDRETQMFRGLISEHGDCTWKVIEKDGTIHTACAISYLGKTDSTMFNVLNNEVECGIVFKMNNDNTWIISLYNLDRESKFHCGKFLREKYNGGGHQGAAGAQIDMDTFINILKNNSI